MAVEMDVIEHLSNLLACGDTRNVKFIMNEESFELALQEKASDLIPIASYYLNKEAMQDSPGVFRYSEKLAVKCAEKGNPKECLMEFLTQIESLDEVKFKILLKPIQTTMLRIPEIKGPLIQCVFNVVYNFINSLPLPQDYHLEKNAKLLLDCDENVQRIRDVYHLIVTFCEPFVNEASGGLTVDKRVKGLRKVVLQALLHLLGNPIVALDLEHNEKGSSTLRVLASKILQFILKLQVDPLQFLTLVEDKELVSVDEERSLINEFSSNEIKFSDLSMAVFFYLLFGENMCVSFPCVYDKLFIYQNCLTLAVTLLRYKETMMLRKGLLLTKAVVDKTEAGSVQFFHLASNVHKEVIQLLSKVAVYHDVEENRKLAVELIKQHFFRFEPKAQFYILLNSGSVAQHPNLVGFLVTLLTGLVRDTFSNNVLKKYFTGKRLLDLLNIFCSLKKGAETDLIENKDQIISALNLVIFLTRRDRENITGVWNFTNSLSQNFINPLREAINLSTAHYQLQLKTFNDLLKTEEGAELAVTVGRQELDNMSVEEKKHVISSGLTVFSLIEHLLSRATECMEDKPCNPK